MNTIKTLSLIVLVIAGAAVAALADVPKLMNYQGRLTDRQGNPVSGIRSMTFEFYDAETGGNVLPVCEGCDPFGEMQNVAIANGIFNVLIGSATVGGVPVEIFRGAPVYLSVRVDGEQLAPRSQVISVGYAFKSQEADHAASVGPDLELGNENEPGRLSVKVVEREGATHEDNIGFEVDGQDQEIRMNWPVRGTFPAPAYDSAWIRPHILSDSFWAVGTWKVGPDGPYFSPGAFHGLGGTLPVTRSAL